VLLLVALVFRAPWPSSWKQVGHIVVVGIFIQALQFCGLYAGLNEGVTAGVSALIVGTMPIFTAIGAGLFLSERIGFRQWLGLGIGLVGVALVVSDKISFTGGSTAGYLYVVLALIGITVGTLYQKRFCTGMDLRTGGVIQLGVASVIVFFLAWQYEGLAVEWTPQLVLSTGWLSLVNSIAAISVLYVLIRRGEASQVASLFYLIPPTTALMGWLILGEVLSPLAVLGFVVASTGVYLSTKK
jgi:drug/metabolite transporter (DMT)-like permease